MVFINVLSPKHQVSFHHPIALKLLRAGLMLPSLFVLVPPPRSLASIRLIREPTPLCVLSVFAVDRSPALFLRCLRFLLFRPLFRVNSRHSRANQFLGGRP